MPLACGSGIELVEAGEQLIFQRGELVEGFADDWFAESGVFREDGYGQGFTEEGAVRGAFRKDHLWNFGGFLEPAEVGEGGSCGQQNEEEQKPFCFSPFAAYGFGHESVFQVGGESIGDRSSGPS